MWSIIGSRFPHRLARILLKVIIIAVSALLGLDSGTENPSGGYNEQKSSSPNFEQSDQDKSNSVNSLNEDNSSEHNRSYLHPTGKSISTMEKEEKDASSLLDKSKLKGANELHQIQEPSIECKVDYSGSGFDGPRK